MEEYLRGYLAVALSFLVLALLALPFLERGSPSFIADLLGIALLAVFIALILAYGRRMLAGEA